MNELLETIEIETAPNPAAAVIWLHGLGADGNDFAPIVPELKLGGAPAIRFVFPHAPMMPVTINNGHVMRAWYDVSFGDLEGKTRQADERGVRASQAAVERLIARENARGVSSRNIVVAGFSQGGAIALQTGLRHPARLAGIMALSTYLPLAEKLPAEASAANRDVPIFYAHGTHDPVIPLAMAVASRERLAAVWLRRAVARVSDAAFGVPGGNCRHQRVAADRYWARRPRAWLRFWARETCASARLRARPCACRLGTLHDLEFRPVEIVAAFDEFSRQQIIDLAAHVHLQRLGWRVTADFHQQRNVAVLVGRRRQQHRRLACPASRRTTTHGGRAPA